MNCHQLITVICVNKIYEYYSNSSSEVFNMVLIRVVSMMHCHMLDDVSTGNFAPYRPHYKC